MRIQSIGSPLGRLVSRVPSIAQICWSCGCDDCRLCWPRDSRITVTNGPSRAVSCPAPVQIPDDCRTERIRLAELGQRLGRPHCRICLQIPPLSSTSPCRLHHPETTAAAAASRPAVTAVAVPTTCPRACAALVAPHAASAVVRNATTTTDAVLHHRRQSTCSPWWLLRHRRHTITITTATTRLPRNGEWICRSLLSLNIATLKQVSIALARLVTKS